jgi:hypothetical protein
MSNTISIEEFNTLQEKLQNTISQTFDYKKQIERLTKELEKEKEVKLKDKASAGINSFLNTLKKGNLAEENEKLKAEIELLNDFKVQNEALKNHIHSLTNKYDQEMSILKSELENYKLNQHQEQSDVLLMVPETNIEKNNIDIEAEDKKQERDLGKIISLFEDLKQKYYQDINDINDQVKNFNISSNASSDEKNDEISSLKIFKDFKIELKNLLNNYSILQYKDLESEEIGKVISNVNNYLNELKSSSTINVSEYINNNYINKNQMDNLKNSYNNIFKEYETYGDEMSQIILKINEEKQKIMNKFEQYKEKFNENLEQENKKNDKQNNDNEINNENKEENKQNNNEESNNEKNNNEDEDTADNKQNKSNEDTTDNKQNNNSETNNNEKEDKIDKNDTQTNLIYYKEMQSFYNGLIEEFNNLFNEINLNIEKNNNSKENLKNKIDISLNNDSIETIKKEIEDIYTNNSNDLIKTYGNNNFGLNSIMSKDSLSIQEFNQLYNNKVDFIIEKYENIYENNNKNDNNQPIDNLTININKLKNDINSIKEKAIKEIDQISDNFKFNINNNDIETQENLSVKYVELNSQNENENENNILINNGSNDNLNNSNNNNSNNNNNNNNNNNSNQMSNIDFEKRLSEARIEIKQQMENQMVEEKQAFVKSLRAGFENEKLQLEKILHDEFEIEINRILDEHYTSNQEKDSKIEKLSKENENMSKELANIRYDLAKSNTKYRQKQEEADNYLKVNASISKELNKIKEELNTRENKSSSEKQALLDEIDQYKDHIAVMEKAKVDLSKRFDEEFMIKENEVNRARQRIDELMRDNYSLEEKFNVKARQTESIQATMLMNQEELEQIKENHSKLIEKYEMLNSKHNNLLKEFDVSKANCDRNSKNILESQEIVKEYKKKTVELTQTNEKNMKKINELEKLYESSKKELEEVTKAKEEEEIKLKSLIEKSEAMTDNIKKITEKNEELMKENKDLEEKWHETENELRVSDRKKIQIIKDLQKQLIKERKTLLKSGDSTDSISAMNSPNQSNYSSPKLYESSNNKINNQEISDGQSSYSASSSFVRRASKTAETLSSSPILDSPPPESTLSNSSAKTTKRKLTSEEKVKILILRNKKLNEELATKSKILQQYILQEHSAELQPDQVNKPKLFNIGILSNQKLLQKTDPAILTQINQKLQKLVEELTTKNMVLKEELEKAKASN